MYGRRWFSEIYCRQVWKMCLNMIRRCTVLVSRVHFCGMLFFWYITFHRWHCAMLATCHSTIVVAGAGIAIGLMSFYFVEPFFRWCPNTELVVFEPLVMKAFLFLLFLLFWALLFCFSLSFLPSSSFTSSSDLIFMATSTNFPRLFFYEKWMYTFIRFVRSFVRSFVRPPSK